MSKKPFTTRIDEAVLALAHRLANAERRSITSLIEVAILEYGERHGEPGVSKSAHGAAADGSTKTGE
jgi:hypothetical protein